MSVSSGSPCTAAEALARLQAGNERFMQGQARFPTVQKDVLAELAKGQRPYATILGCSDSRVPPELIFDARFGELFIIRVAGNVVSPEIMGTLQYAAVQLHTPLFVVLGHEGCGAIEAALAVQQEKAVMPSRIALLLDHVLPALDVLPQGITGEQRMHAAVEANVRWSMHQIVATPEGQARLAEGAMSIVGAVYELETGRVRFLD
jgi:carbonic anhydrase